MKKPFRERIKEGPIVCDGAMGTLLDLYEYDEIPHEIQNLKNPEIVERVHREYVDAGSEIIESNTFSANRLRLSQFHLQEKLREINLRGVEIARRAAGECAYVAGSVGPTGMLLEPIGKIKRQQARDAFKEQIEILLEAGVDLIMLETFVSVQELDEALGVAKELTDLPVVAQKAFAEDGAILSGSFPIDVIEHLIEQGADVVGANCTVGPQRMFSIIRNVHKDGVILSAQPAAGIPTLLNGRSIYHTTPEYLAQYARELVSSGVTLIGACCGSTPAHIRAIADAVKGLKVGRPAPKIDAKMKDTAPARLEPQYYVESSRWSKFARNVGKKFMTTVELDVPRGLDMSSVLEGAQYCYERQIDAVNITEGARARLRMSSIAISVMIQQRVGIEAMTHRATRDHNLIGLQAELLGAYALGIRNILCITGDPAGIGDYPHANSVYDVDSVGLIRAVRSMNEGTDIMGNSIDSPTSFYIACAANPCADNLDIEAEKIERKVEAGANIAFTQPVFEMKTLETFLKRIEHLKLPIMLGIIPLRSYKHADFLHNEVPGMRIPEKFREMMRTAGPDAAKLGVKLSMDFLKEAKPCVAGAYMMPPFQKYQVIEELLGVV
ncbi:MAG: bifunctional homocysteine S-methyltransferase/methylenetetrahydrofolate reductase [Ignavibacteriae bacterium]|nr:bifunctional homocysteine S-methyltransferase/methylenetetrahydrofolate reductase [Ignavibacteria bacterium]MBI3365484.1 bifunctional homocysteine S-methyltransferase/methylenetetrahydrofolate reductase [Ignavibacteriota bacterium]